MGREVELPSGRVHYRWDNALPPVAEVDSGDVIFADLQEVSGGQITRSSTAADLNRMDSDRVYPLSGPVLVKSARRGDVLAVEILDLQPADWGWTSIIPGLGLLTEDFPDPYLKPLDLRARAPPLTRPAQRIPLGPFRRP